jgi:hypothetical protein
MAVMAPRQGLNTATINSKLKVQVGMSDYVHRYPVWTPIDAPDWYKVIATTATGHRFNVWHCASRDQADDVVDRWTPYRPPVAPLTFEIREMRDWLYLETLPHRPAGDIGRVLREDHPEVIYGRGADRFGQDPAPRGTGLTPITSRATA